MELQRARGMRDFSPEEMIQRNSLMEKIRTVFESYGYAPLETPLLERMEVLTAKFAGGESSDVAKEIFSLTDQGKRKLGLRFDLTVPLARFVGMNPTMKMPFKRYQIGRVFRDGPVKLGRYREFWQCDVDIIGCANMTADAECVRLGLDVFDSLGLDVELIVNNRKVLTGILEHVGVETKDYENVIIAIDKIRKIGENGVKKELKDIIDKDLISKLMKILTIDGSNDQVLKQLKNTIGENDGITELEELFSYVDDKRVKLQITLARGLSYYTGTVFEAFLTSGEMTSSVCGGGRYDNLIGGYIPSRKFPAVGISFGIEPITDYLNSTTRLIKKTTATVYVIPIKTTKQCFGICTELRKQGINAAMDLIGKGVSKNLDYANIMGIPYVIIVGENEIKSGNLTLKNMKKGDEKEVKVGDVLRAIS